MELYTRKLCDSANSYYQECSIVHVCPAERFMGNEMKKGFFTNLLDLLENIIINYCICTHIHMY